MLKDVHDSDRLGWTGLIYCLVVQLPVGGGGAIDPEV
jgi:hypothetical protein